MAWAHVQSVSKAATGTAGSSATVTPTTANLSSGTKLIIAIGWASGSTQTVTSVKDASSNAFTKMVSAPNSGGPSGCDLWQLDTPAGDVGTKPVITVQFSGSVQASLLLQEVSGLATGTTTAAVLDGTAGTKTGSGGSSTGSPTYSSSVSNEYLVTVYGDDGGPETLGTPSPPGTKDAATVSANSDADVGIGYGNSTGTTEAGSWPLSGSSAEWGVILVAFKLASGGGASVTGVVATATATAAAGSIDADATITGAVATATAAAPAGTVALSVPGAVATAAAAAPAGSLSAGAAISGAVATATATAPAGSIHAGATITGAVATATATAPAGAAIIGESVTGVVATATATAAAGSLSAGATVAGAVATATAVAPAGTAAASGAGTIYYVSTSGSDSNNGLSPSTPWQTITKVNATTLAAGDSVLFQGGQTWSGTLLYLQYAGTALAPITIGSYGSGQPVLSNGSNDAIYTYDVGGIVIENLAVTGISGSTSYNGIEFYNDTGSQLPAITVQNCTVSGWKYGIIAGGATNGWNGITLTGNTTSSNIYAGVLTYGATFSAGSPAYAHSSVQVTQCTADGNTGSASVTGQWTGSGIVLGSVDGGLIDQCEAHGNGTLNGCTTEGPVGIWTYASTGVTIKRSLAYSNSAGAGGYDGDGFDIDVDCVDCTVEYCLAYGNAGAGILCYGGTADGFWGGTGVNTARYNLCWGNCQNTSATAGYYGEITLAGNLAQAYAFGNTLVARNNGGTYGTPLSLQGATFNGVNAWNNILYQGGTGPLVVASAAYTPAEAYLAGNSYWPVSAGINWGGATYSGLAAWRAATGQETLGSRALGWDFDPQLAAPGVQPAVTSALSFAGASGMQLMPASKLAGRGLDIDGLFGVSPGSQDAFGDAVAVPLWVGAYQGVAQPAPLFDQESELLLSGYWTGITSYVYQRDNITITRGKQDESPTTTPSTLTQTWNNRDGRFSSKNPLGAYYGSFGRNTPVRVSVPDQSTYLRLEDDAVSYISCPASTAIEIAGDFDVRLDVKLTSWQKCTLAARYDGGTTAWWWGLNDDATLGFWYFDSGGTARETTSTSPVPYSGRFALRVTVAASTGTVTFYTAPDISGSWTQLGQPVTTGGTSVRGGTAPIEVGYSAAFATLGFGGLQGRVYAFQLYSGIGGTLKAGPDFTTATAGASTYTDAQSNVWTPQGTGEFSDRIYRGHFELSATPQAWDPTGSDVYCSIQGSGLLRRLQQNTQTLGSVFYRAFTQVDPPDDLIGYWSCEDGNALASGAVPANPTQWASAIPGVAAGTFTGGPPGFASNTDFLCSQSLPTISGSRWHFRLPSRSATDSANVFRFLCSVPAAGDTDGGTLARMFTTGTVDQVDLVYNSATGGTLRLLGYNWTASGTPIFDTGLLAAGMNGNPVWVSIELQTSGSDVQYSVTQLQPGASSGLTFSGTVTGTIGNATELVINALNFIGGENMSGSAVGQITYQGTWESLFDFGSQLDAYQGEVAGQRFARLCAEQGIPVRCVGPLDDTVAMGAQTTLALTDLLQECADADTGMIYEPREALALAYRTRASMQNQAPAVTLGYSQAELADPVGETEDDQYTMNDVTVTRAYASTGGGTGSSAEVAIQTGPLSVQAPPNGVGTYPNSVTQNLFADSQCYDGAGWLAHTGTVDDPRYPQIQVNLARQETLAGSTLGYEVQYADIGDRLTVGDTPDWLPPDGITQLVNGETETLNAFVYDISWCGIPELPYETGTLGDLVFGVDTDGSTLHANATSTATSITVDTTAASPTYLWTVAAADFPFDILVSGERMTVTNITGSSSPQTFTVTRSVNGVVKAQTAGTAVSLFYPAIESL